MAENQTYQPGFYQHQGQGSWRSAQAVIPVVLEYVRPHSAVDIGCGVGTWLRALQEHGVTDVLGVDGDYVRPADLLIDPQNFLAHDLSRPLPITRGFDLVLSLEVAEHLAPACADEFVRTLTGLGPVVLFSAAVPFQGGTHHLNEQWPPYWVEKFAQAGYEHVDCLRPRLWHDERLEPWYAQNLFFFVRADRLSEYPALQQARAQGSIWPLDLVHPRLWALAGDLQQKSLREYLRAFPGLLKRRLRRSR